MKISRLRQPAVSALAVLLISGAGIAFAGGPTTAGAPAVAPVVVAAEPAGPDTDTLQEGDQTTPDTAAEAAGEAVEPAGAAAEAGAEADGPGGHQDNPADSNADHQFEGEE